MSVTLVGQIQDQLFHAFREIEVDYISVHATNVHECCTHVLWLLLHANVDSVATWLNILLHYISRSITTVVYMILAFQ